MNGYQNESDEFYIRSKIKNGAQDYRNGLGLDQFNECSRWQDLIIRGNGYNHVQRYVIMLPSDLCRLSLLSSGYVRGGITCYV